MLITVPPFYENTTFFFLRSQPVAFIRAEMLNSNGLRNAGIIMNFGRNETNKKIHQLKSNGKRLSTKLNVNIFRLFLIGIVFLGAIGISSLAGVINGLAATVPDIDLIHVVPTGYATNVYYRDGSLSEILAGVEANRDYVSITELPDYVKYAFVAMEDERFYEHNGIDVRGIMRALFSDLTTKSLKVPLPSSF